ncbi:unnamed protein product [Umbelopsis ramanniana]
MLTTKAQYSSTSNLAIQSPVPTHLRDPLHSRKDKQVHRYHGAAAVPPSPTQSDHSTRDQPVTMNTPDHGKSHRLRSPTLDQSQNIRDQSSSSIPTYSISDYEEASSNKQFGAQDEKSAYGDPTVLPTLTRPSPSPLSAYSAHSSFSHASSNIDTPHSIFRRQHFFSSSSVSSSMPRLEDPINDQITEKSVAHTYDSRRPHLLERHSMPLPSLPDFEVEAYCPSCKKWVMTRIRYRSGAGVWLFSFVLLVLTIVFFWIPFYVKYFKDVVHFCPSCGHKIGRFRKI